MRSFKFFDYFNKRKASLEREHNKVERRLQSHERQLEEMAKRLRNLEIEVGIYKPPLRKVE